MLDEKRCSMNFSGPLSVKTMYDSIAALQQNLDKWLYEYNHERPHRGYRNRGRRPIERFEMVLKIKEQMKKDAA